MKSKLIALMLAVTLAVSGTGIAAAGSVSHDPTDASTPDTDTPDTPEEDAANATRITADESITMSVGENTTVVEDDPIRITADDSVTFDLSTGALEPADDGLLLVELPDTPNDGANATGEDDGADE